MAVVHDVAEIENKLKQMLNVNTSADDVENISSTSNHGVVHELQDAAREIELKSGQKKKNKEKKRNRNKQDTSINNEEESAALSLHSEESEITEALVHSVQQPANNNSTELKDASKKKKKKPKKKNKAQETKTEEMPNVARDVENDSDDELEPLSALDIRSLSKFLDDKLTLPVLKELEQERIFPLKKKSTKFPHAKYFCRLCEYHCDTVSVCRQHVKDARHRRKREITEQDKKLRNLPAPSSLHLSALNDLLDQVHREHGLQEEDLTYRQEVTKHLEEILSQTQPELRLRVYGSSLSGLGLKCNDLNIDMVIPASTNPAHALTTVYKTLMESEEYENVKSNFSAKVPSVMFTVGGGESPLVGEITVNNDTAFSTNRLLSLYRKRDNRVPALATAFRHWAKVCQVDRQAEGSLPQYCFGVMTVYYLQQCRPPVLPILWKDLSEEYLKRPKTQADISSMLDEVEMMEWETTNTDSVGQLWLDMLKFYGVCYDLGSNVICIKQPKLMSRSEKKWNNKRIAIEDPFFTKRNVARSLSNARVFEYFFNCLRRSCLYFGLPSNQQDTSILSTNTKPMMKSERKRDKRSEESPECEGRDALQSDVKLSDQKTDMKAENIKETELTGSGEVSSDGGIQDNEFFTKQVHQEEHESSDCSSDPHGTREVEDNVVDDSDTHSNFTFQKMDEETDTVLSSRESETDTIDLSQMSRCLCGSKGNRDTSSVALEDTAVCSYKLQGTGVCDTCASKQNDADMESCGGGSFNTYAIESSSTGPQTGSSLVRSDVGVNRDRVSVSEDSEDDEETEERRNNSVNIPIVRTRSEHPPGAEYHFTFSTAVLTDGKGPAVICTVCDKEGHLKQACPDEKLPDLIELPPMTKHHLQQLTLVIKQVPRDFRLSPAEINDREMIRKDLERFIQELYDDAQLTLFGSSCNGFGFHFSDLDICVTFRDKSPEGLNFVEVIEAMAKKLKTHRGLYNVFPITTAKVPIIKFRHRSSNLEGDISLYNILAQHNTRLLHTYSCIDTRVNILGFAIKVFAKVCDIGDASKGSLSSYAYMLLMIHYLQHTRPPVIPVLQELYITETKPEVIVDGWNTWFYSDLKKLPAIWPHYGKNNQSVGELWAGFFRYYMEEFSLEDHVITIKQFSPLTKFEKLWNGVCMAIEDPFDLNHNLGAGLSRKMNKFILTTLINARLLYGTAVSEIPEEFQSIQDYFFDRDLLTEGEPPNDRCCRVCNKIGHIAKECPRVAARKEREALERQRRKEMKAQNELKAREKFNKQNSPNRAHEKPARSLSDPDERGSRGQQRNNTEQYHRQHSYSPVKTDSLLAYPPGFSTPPNMRRYHNQRPAQTNFSQSPMPVMGGRGSGPGQPFRPPQYRPQSTQSGHQAQASNSQYYYNRNSAGASSHQHPSVTDHSGRQNTHSHNHNYTTGSPHHIQYSRGPVPFNQYQRQERSLPNGNHPYIPTSANQQSPHRYSQPGPGTQVSRHHPQDRQVTRQNRSYNT